MELNKYFIFSGVIVSAFFLLYFISCRNMESGIKPFIICGMFIAFYIFSVDFLLVLECWNTVVWFYLFYLPFIFCFYPVVYHYLINVTKEKNTGVFTNLFMYLPLLVLIIVSFFYLPLDSEGKTAFVKRDFNSLENESIPYLYFQIIIYSLYYIQVVIFISLFIKLYIINTERKENDTGATQKFLPKWIFAFISVLIIFELFYVIVVLFDIFQNKEILEPISVLILVILLGFLGVRHDELVIEMKLAQIDIKSKTGYSILPLTDDEITEIMNQVENLIKNQKLYILKGLKLEQVAKKLHIPLKKISASINKTTGEDFSNYLNAVRVDEAIKLIKQKSGNLKIEEIYLEVGYHTRSTFNRAFKAKTGFTPSEYIKNV